MDISCHGSILSKQNHLLLFLFCFLLLLFKFKNKYFFYPEYVLNIFTYVTCERKRNENETGSEKSRIHKKVETNL
jgi:hypothetical protein